ncbi:glucosamine inositolphosphorylceramide transferase family protein [Hyphomicrobium sp.]|uniref:glucosamine inositolphosphorylceramide transferase family protein n=1 Tax=Hyphomicrobium sp. TaxID=82 RepID=UPI002D77B29D|nr:hypothetical protein [Hyphomicrobium sp.]HET6391059.1 hypothetical protein [Hyphomicrobium sp.]
MKICVVIGETCAREWHKVLVARLLAEEHDLALYISDGKLPLPAALPLTLAFERVVYGISEKPLIAAIPSDEAELGAQPIPHQDSCVFDIVIRLDGGDALAPDGRRVLRPLFNGLPSEAGALAAMLDDRQVTIGVEEATHGGASTAYAIETERPTILSKTLNNACGRMIDLLVWECSAVPVRPAAGTAHAGNGGVTRASLALPMIMHAVSALSHRLARRLDTMSRGGDRWVIGWRNAAGTRFDPAGAATTITYSRIPDDGRRFLADPFPAFSQGHAWVFCEEYPYATGKGIISVIDLNDPKMAPRPIIEEPHHLSYPMIFADNGQCWMIPESGTSDQVSLYRCKTFPFEWVKEAVLIENVAASDPTLYRDASGYWLFFASCAGKGSPSDRLCLFHAPALQGPWAPCGPQPLSLDPRTSRPAGHIIGAGETLYRPTQDCTHRYGGAIVWCRFTLPAGRAFMQDEVGTLRPRDVRELPGGHTFNRCGPLETVDVFGAPKSDLIEFVYETKAAARDLLPSTSGHAAVLKKEQTYAPN